jgi:hypothetical protein
MGHNGPSLISRVLKKWCNVDNLTSMDYNSVRGFNVLYSCIVVSSSSLRQDERIFHASNCERNGTESNRHDELVDGESDWRSHLEQVEQN